MHVATAMVSLGAALAFGNAAQAQGFTILDGQMEGQQVMSGPGDVGVIQLGGLLATVGPVEDVVVMGGDQQTFSNSGTILGSGLLSVGVFSSGGDADIFNFGNIWHSGIGAVGIFSGGDFAYIENDGSIETTGVQSSGIVSTGAIADVFNYGSISAVGSGVYTSGSEAIVESSGSILVSGDGAVGIRNDGAYSEAYNYGLIETTGLGGMGILATTPEAYIENGGDIVTHGDGSLGIVAAGAISDVYNYGFIGSTGAGAGGIATAADDVWIVNDGLIEGVGPGSFGVISAGEWTQLTNSGGIFVNPGEVAIGLAGNYATLVLESGTVIQGGMSFAGSEGLLVIGDGLNTALTFNPTPAYLNTSGNPFATSGDLLAVVDPAGLDAEIAGADQLSATIADAVGHRIMEARDNRAWAMGIGAFGSQTGALSDLRFHNALAGFLAGVDWQVNETVEAGVFGGGAVSSATSTAQQIDASSALIGSRLRWQNNGFFTDLAAFVGGGAYGSDRLIVNNLVIGGLQHAVADYGGYFWGASFNAGKSYETSRAIFTPSLRLRYLGVANGAFAETGSAADLSVEGRSASIYELRSQIAVSTPALPVDGGRVAWGGRVGVERKWTGHQSVSANLLAQPIVLSGGGTRSNLRGFVGLDARFTAESGYTLGAAAEFGAGDAGASASFNVLFKKPF